MANRRGLKRVLYTLMVLTAVAILAVFAGYRQLMESSKTFLPQLAGKAKIALDKIEHAASKNGKTQWRLSAASARLIGESQETILEKPAIQFFTADGDTVYLNADRGVLHIESNNMDVSGNVVMKSEGCLLKTQRLHYNHKRRLITSDVPVKLSHGRSKMSGAAMTIDLNTSKLRLIGNVKGLFYDQHML